MQKAIDLEPGHNICPFCGFGTLRVAFVYREWHVICGTCRALGPGRRGKLSAIQAWDTREEIEDDGSRHNSTK